MPHFKDTEYETRRCPRRHMLDHPDIIPLFALRRDVEGVSGRKQRKHYTAAAIEGLAVLDDAVAWRAEEARKEAEKGKPK